MLEIRSNSLTFSVVITSYSIHYTKLYEQESLIGKRITFIPTASIPESIKFYVNSGRKALEKMGLQVDELEITKASTSEIRDKLQANDFIYVSGGNTFFLLQELKRSGADKIIIEEINSGKMYIGESAGSIILSPSIEFVKDMDDFEKAPNLRTYSALNRITSYNVCYTKLLRSE